MASPFDTAGAEHIASGFAPLTMDRYITGLVTNRSALRDAAVPYLNAKFYQAGRFDSLWDGSNMENSAKLTLIRRPGHSVYNSQIFPPVLRYHPFHLQIDGTPSIRLMVDTAAAVYDGTGPDTKTLIVGKSAGAGKTGFQGVGNTLYMATGKENLKWTVSTRSYQPTATYSAGEFINDPNRNLQVAFGIVGARITASAVSGTALVLTFDGRTPYAPNETILLNGLTVAAIANGLTLQITAATDTTATVTLPSASAATWGTTADTGTASGGGSGSDASGITAAAPPDWATTPGAVTVDGTVLWICKGPDVQLWGAVAPAAAPTITQQALTGTYPNWAASTYYSPHLLTYNAANPNVFAMCTQAGTTGSVEPVLAPTVGDSVTDGGVVWKTVDTAWPGAATPATLGQLITGRTSMVVPPPGPFDSGWAFAFGLQSSGPGATDAGNVVTIYYSDSTSAPPDNDLITAFQTGAPTYLFLQMLNALPGFPNPATVLVTGVGLANPPGQSRPFYYFTYRDPGPAQSLYSTGQGGYRIQYQRLVPNVVAYRCVQAGVTGDAAPAWVGGYGTQIADGGVVWQALGGVPEWVTLENTSISLAPAVLDANGFIQTATLPAKTGDVLPTWNDTLGGLTLNDGAMTWACGGAFLAASVGQIGYAYSFKNSVAKTESDVSPVLYTSRQVAHRIQVQGGGSGDGQIDTIVVYRTVDGGSTLLYDNEFAAPVAGSSGLWTFLDATTDDGLNVLIQGARDGTNAPPPAGLNALSYHMSRIWGAVGPLLSFTAAPGANVGVGMEAWSSGNVFALTGVVARTVPWDLPDGVLLAFTYSGPVAIWGQGTASDPFYAKTFTQGAGLLSYDELAIGQGWIYQFTTDRRLLSFQPTSGYGVNGSTQDAGAPIGDQFKKVTTAGYNEKLYTPGAGYITWHADGTNDVGLFVADGSVGWYRFSQITEPETGFLWSTFASIQGGTSAVSSVETEPGRQQLLVGPKVSGPILARDSDTNSDNGTPYPAYATLGSLELAQPTEIAEVVAIILDANRVGTSPGVAILLGEIAATIKRPFLTLQRTGFDPANLPPSETLFNEYFAVEQTGQTNQCRHMQLRVSFPAEDAPNELLGHAVYGRHIPQRRQE